MKQTFFRIFLSVFIVASSFGNSIIGFLSLSNQGQFAYAVDTVSAMVGNKEVTAVENEVSTVDDETSIVYKETTVKENETSIVENDIATSDSAGSTIDDKEESVMKNNDNTVPFVSPNGAECTGSLPDIDDATILYQVNEVTLGDQTLGTDYYGDSVLYQEVICDANDAVDDRFQLIVVQPSGDELEFGVINESQNTFQVPLYEQGQYNFMCKAWVNSGETKSLCSLVTDLTGQCVDSTQNGDPDTVFALSNPGLVDGVITLNEDFQTYDGTALDYLTNLDVSYNNQRIKNVRVNIYEGIDNIGTLVETITNVEMSNFPGGVGVVNFYQYLTYGTSYYIELVGDAFNGGCEVQPVGILVGANPLCTDVIVNIDRISENQDTTVRVICEGVASGDGRVVSIMPNSYTSLLDIYTPVDGTTNVFEFNPSELQLGQLGTGEYNILCFSDASFTDTCSTPFTIGDGEEVCEDITVGSISVDRPNNSEVPVGMTTLEGDVIDPITNIWVILDNNQRIQGTIDANRWSIENVPVSFGRNGYRIMFENDCSNNKIRYYLDGNENLQQCTGITVTPETLVAGSNNEFVITCSGENVDAWNVEVTTSLGTTILFPGSGSDNVFEYAVQQAQPGEVLFECVVEGSVPTTRVNPLCSDSVKITPEVIQECIELPNFNVNTISLSDTVATIGGPLSPVNGVQDIVVQVFEGPTDDINTLVGTYSGSDIFYESNNRSVLVEGLNPSTQYYAWIDVLTTQQYCPIGTDIGFETTVTVCEELTNYDFTVTTPAQTTVGEVYLEGTVTQNVTFIEVVIVGQESGIYPTTIQDGTWRTIVPVPVTQGINKYRVTAKNECSEVSTVVHVNGTFLSCVDDPSYTLTNQGIKFFDVNTQVTGGETIASPFITVQGSVISGQDKNVSIIRSGDSVETFVIASTQNNFEYDVPLVAGPNSIQVVITTTNGTEICDSKQANITVQYNPVEIQCTGIDVAPSTVIQGSGDDFVVTCQGVGVQERQVSYDNVVAAPALISQPINGTINTFAISQDNFIANQNYNVTCIAVDSTVTGNYNCTDTIRVTKDICIDEINFFSIDGVSTNPIETSNTTEVINGTVDVAATERVERTIYEGVLGGVFFASGVATMDPTNNTYTFVAPIIPDSNIVTYIWVEPIEKYEACDEFNGNDILFVANKECTDQLGVVTITSSDENDISLNNTTDITVTTTLGFNKKVVLKVTNNGQTRTVGMDTDYSRIFTFSNIELGEGVNTFEVVVTPLDSSGNEIEGCDGEVTKSLVVTHDTVCEEGIEALTATVVSDTVTTDSVDVVIGTTYAGEKEITIEVFNNGSNDASYTTSIISSGQLSTVSVLVGEGSNIIKVTADIQGCDDPKDTSVFVTRTPVCPADYDFDLGVDTQSGIVNYDGDELVSGTANPDNVESITIKVSQDNSGNESFVEYEVAINSDGTWSQNVLLLGGQLNYVRIIANGTNQSCSLTKDIEIKQVNECIEDTFGDITYSINGEVVDENTLFEKGTQEFFVTIENSETVREVRVNVNGINTRLERTLGGFKGMIQINEDQNTIRIGIRGVNPKCETVQQITVYTEVVTQCEAPVNDVIIGNILVNNGSLAVPVTITNVQNSLNDGTKSVVYTLTSNGQVVDTESVTTNDSQIVFNTLGLQAGSYLITVNAQGVQNDGSIIEKCAVKGDQLSFEINEPNNPVCEPTEVTPNTIVTNTDGEFQIVCEGNDNIIGFTVEYSVPQADGSFGTGEITTAPVTIGNTQTFTYTDTDIVGTYTFSCVGWTLDPDPINEEVQCGSDTGIVIDAPGGQCPDKFQVTADDLTLSSTRIQGTKTARITGSYDATNPVIAGVTYGGNDVETVLVNGTRTFSIVVELENGVNTFNFQLRSIAKNLLCSADTSIEIVYTPTTGGQCPADQQVSASDLTLEAEVVSGVTSTTITGSYLINGPVGSVSYNGQIVAAEFIDDRAVFALSVALQDGNNEFVFTITPKSTDTDCKPVTKKLTLTYPPADVCEENEKVGDIAFIGLPTNNLFTSQNYQFTGVIATGNLASVSLNGAEITVADDGTFVVSGSFAQEGSLTLSFAVVADDVTCNETQELVLTYDEPNGGVCEDIRDIQILEGTTSVTNSVTTYEFNGSYLDTNLATFLITQNGVQIDASNIALSKVGTSSRTNFRTVASLNEGRNVFVFTATSEQSEEICNDSETVVITRNTRTTGGSSGGGGRASSILCGNRRIDDSRGVREQCDDGNTRSGDGCSSTCQIEEEPVCGNGIIELGEMCDDSNRTNGDGCSATCDIEDEEIKREIVREQIKETIRKRRPVPLSYTPPRVLPKTGNKVRSGTDFRKMIR